LLLGEHYWRYHGAVTLRRALGVVLAILLVNSSCLSAARAQSIPVQSARLPGVSLASELAPVQIADVSGVTGAIPTDVTPSSLGREREYVSPGLAFRIFQKLPERLWFNSTTEVTQRLETNVFFTARHNVADYVFRVLPNVTVGYNVLGNTSIYCNYFVIKDVYADNKRQLTFPTTQSLLLGFRQDIPIARRTTGQLDFQARELWQTSHLHQADLIPGFTLTHVLRPNIVLFGNVLLQMRGRNYFVAPTRELDPFYSVGAVVRRGSWTFSATDTYVTNFRSPPFHGSVPHHGNVSMIGDFEVSHPIHRNMQGLVWFIRAEPIWNWASARLPGLSGFDFRLFGGLRLALSKPSLAATVTKLRQQLIESEGLAPVPKSN